MGQLKRGDASQEADNAAVAPDKAALLPGQSASFSNVTGYSRGINGVMVDVAHLPATASVTAENFVFRTGSGNGVWAGAAAPSAVTFRRGAGDGGSDRVTLTFPDNRLVNRWLHVTFTPPAVPGSAPATPDVFAFGNLRGETGDATAAARVAVNAFDVLRSRAGRNKGPRHLYCARHLYCVPGLMRLPLTWVMLSILSLTICAFIGTALGVLARRT